MQDAALLTELNGFVDRLTADEFLALLPSLRAAFAWFTPRERAEIAEQIAQMRGLAPRTLLSARLTVDPVQLAGSFAFDAALVSRLRAYGLARRS